MKRAVTFLLVLAGCAYYNGLYNANRLADEARKAEREGRSGEARSLWSRAAIKAESVSVRYPGSRWRDDALLLWGQSLRRIDACTRAVGPLRVASDSSADRRIADDARLLLAECRLFMREPDSAVVALGPVIDGGGPRRPDALVLRARAYLAIGRPGAALADARLAGTRAAAFPRATALAQLGRAAEARALLDSLVTGPFAEPAWVAVLGVLAAVDPDAASSLTVRLARREDLGTGVRARLLVADGERWLAARRSLEASTAFAAAAALAPDSVSGRVAAAHQLMADLRRTDDPATLDSILATVRRVTAPGGQPVQIAGRALNLLPEVIEALRHGDEPARLFLAAESVRDSLAAPRLAAALFLAVARSAGDQVLAPKAMLAAMALRPDQADSLAAVLHGEYAGSVYVLALRGEAGARYAAVEDSLRQVFAELRDRTNTERRPGRPGERARGVRGNNE